MKFFKIAVFFAALGLCTLNAANLLVNSDFSRLNNKNFPAYWSIVSNGGAKSAEIAGPDGKVVKVLEFDLAKHPKATRIEQVPTLVPNRTYKVSFYAKSENLTKGGAAMKRIRILALLLCFAVLVPLTACSPEEHTEQSGFSNEQETGSGQSAQFQQLQARRHSGFACRHHDEPDHRIRVHVCAVYRLLQMEYVEFPDE